MDSDTQKRVASLESELASLRRKVDGLVGSQAFDQRHNDYLMSHLDQNNMSRVSGGLLQSWQDSAEDNMDDSHPMTLAIYMPDETKEIHAVLLRIKKKKYRADSKAASSGGSTTSGASSSSTTEGGGSVSDTTGTTTHKHLVDGSTDSADGSVGAHTHDISFLTAAESPHSHSVTIDSHTHGMSHTHSISSHTHGLTYGIYEAALPGDAGFTVAINGTDRTAALGGPFASDQDELDITSYFSVGQWNTVVIGCGTGVEVRCQAQVFMQAFISPIGGTV